MSLVRTFTSEICRDSVHYILSFLHLSSHHQLLKLTKQSHARLLSLGFSQNPVLATKLISAYAINGYSADSQIVFDSVQQKSVFLWNSLINGYVRNLAFDEALESLNEMCRSSVLPDDFTISTALKACAENQALVTGKTLHGRSIRSGSVLDTVVSNSLMSMYCKCGELADIRKVFDEMTHRNVASWNVLISGCATLGNKCFDNVLEEVVNCMLNDGMKPDSFTLSTLLPLCAVDKGRQFHCYIVKNELGLGVHLGCCLIDMYSKSNRVAVARRVFKLIQISNVYTWTSMFNGYVLNGDFDEGLLLFIEMVRVGIEPNKVSLVSILPACCSFARLMAGKQLHSFAIRRRLNCDLSLCNALIDMYAKCGKLNSARNIFENISSCKDPISWSTMISGYGLHGKGEEAITLFDEMLKLEIKPDTVTIVSVISACGRSGLVKEGLNIYDLVTERYGIKPTKEICACVVDILGRSGQLDEALSFIKQMVMEPGPSVWGALMSASVMHGNLEMQELAYKFLIEIEPQNPSNYISLSNLHASSRRWSGVAEVRSWMKDRGLRKVPGYSWISLGGKTHSFYVSDKSHPNSNSIYAMLNDLLLMMKETGLLS